MWPNRAAAIAKHNHDDPENQHAETEDDVGERAQQPEHNPFLVSRGPGLLPKGMRARGHGGKRRT